MSTCCLRVGIVAVLISAGSLFSAGMRGHDVYINTALEQNSGEMVRGPVDVHILGINPIRNNIAIGEDVKFPNGPSLDGLPFIPALPAAKGSGAPEPPEALRALSTKEQIKRYRTPSQAPTTALDLVTSARNILDSLIGDSDKLNAGINTMAKGLNDALASVKSLADRADITLKSGGTHGHGPDDEALLALIKGADKDTGTVKDTGKRLDAAAKGAIWPGDEIADLQRTLATLASTLLEIPGRATDWNQTTAEGVKPAYTDAVKQVNDMIVATNGLADSKNATFTAFQTATQQAQAWSQLLAGIQDAGPSAFRIKKHVSCGFAFDKTKDTKLQIVTTDRLTQGAKLQTQELITVECTSPLSVSAGFGFSTLPERDIVFVPSNMTDAAGKTVNIFGYQSVSSFKPIPLILLNARIWEPSDLLSVHISGGAGVDLKTSQVGTDVDYFMGPSFAFRRTLFLTPALHVGRVVALASNTGFAIGSTVPTGLSAPPIEKQWSKGFVFAITWKIR